jgi:hypothetical protein
MKDDIIEACTVLRYYYKEEGVRKADNLAVDTIYIIILGSVQSVQFSFRR